jgi:hypothetical protein
MENSIISKLKNKIFFEKKNIKNPVSTKIGDNQ